MQRGTMLDQDYADAEAKRSESPPDSNAQRKRALADASLRETSPTSSPQRDDEKSSPKRAKASEPGHYRAVETTGIGPPHRRPQAPGAEPHHGSISQMNVASLQNAMGEDVAAGTGVLDRQRLLLQELMASSDPSGLSLLGAHQHPSASLPPWGAAPALAMAGSMGGSNVGLFNQQATPDLAQILQLRALNQLSMQGFQASRMTGLGALSMGMNAYGMPSSVIPSFVDPRHSMQQGGLGIPGMGPGMGAYGALQLNSAPSLAAMRAGLGGSADLQLREMYAGAGAGLPAGMPSMNNPNQMFGMVQPRGMMPPAVGGVPMRLPVVLAQAEDNTKLSKHQVQLRHQIEAFQATDDDVSTHTRGRNKPIVLGQVGIRCRHCAHMPVCRRQKGSTYFPATLLGLYQAAQNMSTTHMQCGLCMEMPEEIKTQFTSLLSSKAASSGAGRPYWAQSAKKLGLVDTEDGICFIRDLPPGTRIIRDELG